MKKYAPPVVMVAMILAGLAWQYGPSLTGPQKLRVLVVAEQSDMNNTTPGVQAIRFSSKVLDYLDTHCMTDPNGQPAYRFADKDDDYQMMPEVWKRLRATVQPTDVPAVAIQYGNRFALEKRPGNETDFLKLLKRYGGE